MFIVWVIILLMSLNFTLFSLNARFAISFAAFKTHGMFPPFFIASYAIVRHGNLSSSGDSKVRFPISHKSIGAAFKVRRSG